MAEKVTEMKLRVKVDLQCHCCYKKIKKILCKFPEIRDQVYDEKNNIVKIIVVCCNPEKIRDKLCCKGEKVIKSIEIVVPPPPSPKPKPKPTPTPTPTPSPPPPKPASCPHWHPGCPCYQCGWPVPPPPCYEYYCYPYYRRCYVSPGDYFIEENPSACSIM